jgi:CRISPR-associated endonuclease Csn1
MRYKVGLDVGIASVGWATVELNEKDEPIRIIEMGSRIFDAAENPQDGASLALPRREARGARRRLRRHRHRLERIRSLILSEGLLTKEERDSLFVGPLSDIYSLRAKALDEKLSPKELARVLIHLAQRRGFSSNRKADSADKEAGLLLTAVNQNRDRIRKKGYRTVGEMFYLDEDFGKHKRNKGGDYSHTVDRAMIADEARLIFANQRALGLSLNEAFEQAYMDILLSQRSFDQGPGEPSPYGGNQIEKMLGSCTFETGERRAVKAAYSFEYFSLLQNINHMRILSDGAARELTKDEKNRLVALAHASPGLTYSRLRKELSLSPFETFAGVSYSAPTIEEAEKKAKFPHLKAYHEIRKALNKVAKDSVKNFTKNQLNQIGYAITVFKNDGQITEHLQAAGVEEAFIPSLLGLSGFTKTGHLSVTAYDKIIPFLEQGLKYNEACQAAGYDFRAHAGEEKARLLPPVSEELENITNPVVRRATAQTIKVINAIIRKMGDSPVYLSIELAREMAKNKKERDKIKKEQQENHARNQRILERIKNEYKKANPTGMDLVKLKLWEEQGGICPYSLAPLDPVQIFDPGYADIDHIAPYSISFDDSYRNKVLVSARENRQKGNRLPMEYLKGEGKDKFCVWVSNTVRDPRKRQLLLKEKFTEEDEKSFKERNLQDTKYIASFLKNYIEDHLLFAPSNTGRKKRVSAVNGAVTSYMRKRWGISKVREDGDLHHAVDALVIACISDSLIQKVSRHYKYRETEYEENTPRVDPATGEVLDRFPLPWPLFRKEVEVRLSNNPSSYLSQLHFYNYQNVDTSAIKPPFVSRMPKRKVTGAAHKDTVRSPKALDEGFTVSKKPLTALKLKDGEIEGYYKPQSDTLLYNALKERLALFGGKADKAFEQPFYKPTKDGRQGPLVKKVKLLEKTTQQVPLHKGTGVADHDNMVRIDVFFVEGEGYYLVPIYIADTLKKTLPNKAVVAFKPYAQWKEMEDENFIFSLYPNDLIKVTSKKDMTLSVVHPDSTLPKELVVSEGMLYYVSANISVASIRVIDHDNSYTIKSMGIKTLKSLEKYQVDVLGSISKVKKEKRQYFK